MVENIRNNASDGDQGTKSPFSLGESRTKDLGYLGIDARCTRY